MSPTTRSIRSCPTCGEARATPVFDNFMAPLDGLDMSYSVSSCDQCGFLYARSLPSADAYIEYYKNLSKYDRISDVHGVSHVDATRASAVVALCRPLIQKTAPIADLGCGVGHLLNAFSNAGFTELYGLDPAPNATETARAAFGLHNVHNGLLSEAATLLPLAKMKLVCLTGVLEHLWNLRENLSSLIDELESGTIILIEVPALERFSQRPHEPFGEFSLEHIQYFSSQSLTCLFSALGVETVSTSLIDLPPSTTDSLIGVFRKCAPMLKRDIDHNRFDVELIGGYITQSQSGLDRAVDRIGACEKPIILYGAGSHTARLLPVIEDAGLDHLIREIVDQNPNLQEKYIGRWRVASPLKILENPDVTIVISSFRAQNSIKSSLVSTYTNDVLCLYPENG